MYQLSVRRLAKQSLFGGSATNWKSLIPVWVNRTLFGLGCLLGGRFPEVTGSRRCTCLVRSVRLVCSVRSLFASDVKHPYQNTMVLMSNRGPTCPGGWIRVLYNQ